MSAAPATTNNTPAQKEPQNVVAQVGRMVDNYLSKGSLILPADYSPENALKSAWLTLQGVQDRNGNPALQVCTQESVINALLDMCVQGLNPAKKQLYFIVYGKSLVCQRSYFGDQALALRVQPGIEIYYDVVYDKDELEIGKVRGRTVIVKHSSKLENQDINKIKAAYCGIYDTETGEDLGVELMTMEQIKKSWGMSKTYNPGGNKGTHHDFPDQMALRTVIRRRCKPIINASSDALLLESVRRQEIDEAQADADAEAAQRANSNVIEMPIAAISQNATPPEAEQPAEQAEEPKLLTRTEATKALKLTDDQWNYVADTLTGKDTDLSAEQFLSACVVAGDKAWKDVSPKLAELPDKPQGQAALDTEAGF